jgi:signal transduction histidine kinase
MESFFKEMVGSRDDLLSIASHEIRSPLHLLQLQVQTALLLCERGQGESEQMLQILRKSERQVKRLSGLVDNLLDDSRIRSGNLKLTREEVDLPLLLRDLLAQADEELLRAGCPVTLSADVNKAARCRGDRSALEQVVTNLLANAMKYGAGAPIEIAVENVADRVRLSCRDHGIGIAKEHHERIFDRFQRVGADPRDRGLGLGLYIVRSLVTALGGTVGVDSEPGQGACFTVDLPRLR